jgi:hypothetical protein
MGKADRWRVPRGAHRFETGVYAVVSIKSNTTLTSNGAHPLGIEQPVVAIEMCVTGRTAPWD